MGTTKYIDVKKYMGTKKYIDVKKYIGTTKYMGTNEYIILASKLIQIKYLTLRKTGNSYI